MVLRSGQEGSSVAHKRGQWFGVTALAALIGLMPRPVGAQNNASPENRREDPAAVAAAGAFAGAAGAATRPGLRGVVSRAVPSGGTLAVAVGSTGSVFKSTAGAAGAAAWSGIGA